MLSSQRGTRLIRVTKIPIRSLSTSQGPARRPIAERCSQTLTLPDGRELGYAEWGHPEGYPLLFFHGFPTSRLEGWPADKLGIRHRIRVIALDRPGFGLSTFQPRRRITDWPTDVVDFTHSMGLKRFAVMGLSGGGPYALACAHRLPKEMLLAVGVFAGAPPWEAGSHNMALYRRISAIAAMHAPGAFGAFSDALVGLARWLATSGPATKRIDLWLESEQQKRKKSAAHSDGVEHQDGHKATADEDGELSTLERRELLLCGLLDGFAQGSRAMVQEARLLSEPDWGFRFEDISYDPIHIWHGTNDVSAPFSMIQYMAKRLPHSALYECEGDTHFTMTRHLEEALVKLTSQVTSRENAK